MNEKDFVRRADAVCLRFFPIFDALPEGVEGAKSVGLGKLMYKLVVALDHVSPPQRLDARVGCGRPARRQRRRSER